MDSDITFFIVISNKIKLKKKRCCKLINYNFITFYCAISLKKNLTLVFFNFTLNYFNDNFDWLFNQSYTNLCITFVLVHLRTFC